MSQWSFSFQSSLFTVTVSVFATVAVCALAWAAWRRSGYRSSTLMLELLRVALVLIGVVMLNQPETIRQFLPSQRPTIVVLGDQSKSMSTKDVASAEGAMQTRAEAIGPFLEQQTWASIEDRFDVIRVPFASAEQSDASDLHAALQSALDEHPNLRAVVLASDGDWNSGKPPVRMATRLRLQQIPIFAVPAGSRTKLPDIALLSFDLPHSGVAGKKVRIPFAIESSLPRDHTVGVTLKSSAGNTLTRQVRIAAMGRTRDAILWQPDDVGDYTLTLNIPPHSDEQLADNNQKSMSIRIQEEKLKVLVIESLPRWEYRYLRNALSRDPGVEVSCLLFHPGLSKVGGGNKDYIQAFPEARKELQEYDVIFLGDVGVAEGQLTEEQCRLLRGLVEQGASGLVFMPGWQGNALSLAHSPLDALLPVIFDDSQPGGWGSRTPSHFALTQWGRRSLLTKLADTEDDNRQVWENLPGFQWHAPIVRAKAGTDVLAVHQEASNEYGRLPLLVTRTFGNGKVLFMGTDGAWRWRRGVEDLYHYRFWGQVVRWMAYQRNMDKGTSMRFYYSPEAPQVRQTISLSASVMDKSGEPLSKGDVSARIIAPSGRTETVYMKSTGAEWGAFSGVFTPREPGRHQVTLRCKQNASSLETRFDIQGATLEQIGQPARADVLQELATVSRGRMLKVEETEAIVQAISSVPEPPKQIRRVQLWSHPLAAATMITLLGMFWVGRKMVGLI